MKKYIKWCVVFLLYAAGWLWLILDPVMLQAPALRGPCFFLLVDSIPFLIGLAWLHSPHPIIFWKPIVYLALIVALSVLFSMAPPDLINTFRGSCFLLELAFFAAVNYYLWENLFKATGKRLLGVSILIGFINAVLCIFSVPLIKG